MQLTAGGNKTDSGGNGKRREVMGVAVALHHLRGDIVRLQSEAGTLHGGLRPAKKITNLFRIVQSRAHAPEATP